MRLRYRKESQCGICGRTGHNRKTCPQEFRDKAGNILKEGDIVRNCSEIHLILRLQKDKYSPTMHTRMLDRLDMYYTHKHPEPVTLPSGREPKLINGLSAWKVNTLRRDEIFTSMVDVGRYWEKLNSFADVAKLYRHYSREITRPAKITEQVEVLSKINHISLESLE